MKVLIDLIEDMREAIKNSSDFSLSAMGLEESSAGEFTPTWSSHICNSVLDKKKKQLFFFLGKEAALNTQVVYEELNSLENEEMMYEVFVSYSQHNQRVDKEIIGFGESLEEKKYLLFVTK